ncbi:MAG: hypothetical protein RLZZ298_3482 [Pseudomonadota bacterium]|jgi:hypothetical protein
MQGLLSFDKAPPFAAPLRFFLTAPFFGLLAGLLIVWEGPSLLVSRWTPSTLAATHLLTIGFMLQTMLGALIQILPVVAGVNLANPLRVARWLHAGLSSGTLLLVAGFLFGQPDALASAAIILGLTLASFLVVIIPPLLRAPSSSPTIRGLKLAMLGLAGTVVLGVVLALALAWGWPLPLLALADLHAAWGLGAWGGVLLAAIAYVVVPMFQLTPGYQARLSWWFPVLIFACIGFWSVSLVFELPPLGQLAQVVASLLGLVFCVITLRLQFKRRRARADATYRYWQLGLSCTIIALFSGLTATFWPVVANSSEWPLLFGILLIAGGFVSFIVGMLYKIVPFLAWLHLQNLGQSKVPAPAMNKILSEKDMNRQMVCHVLAIALALGAVFLPEWLARLAGLAFVVANVFLIWNLAGAVSRYRQHALLIAQKLAAL